MGRENAIRKSRFLRRRLDPDGAVRIEARLTPADGARIMEAIKAKAGVFYDEARSTGLFESMSSYLADGLVSLADDAVCGNGTGIAKPTVVRGSILLPSLAVRSKGMRSVRSPGWDPCPWPPLAVCSATPS